MDDVRLAQIEAFWTQRLNREHPVVDAACRDVPDLIAEIRRLRAESGHSTRTVTYVDAPPQIGTVVINNRAGG